MSDTPPSPTRIADAGGGARPPQAARRPAQIVAHGDSRTDDWLWIRERTDPEVLELLAAETAHTDAATRHLQPLVERLYGEMLEHVRLTDVSYPAPRGGWAYYVRTIDGEEHSVRCRRPAAAPPPAAQPAQPDEHETVLLDENEMARGYDYFAIESTALSHDQRLLAYAVDSDGSERMTVRIRDLDTGTDLDDRIEDTYYGLAFGSDGTLFYTRADEAMRPFQYPATRARYGSRNRRGRVGGARRALLPRRRHDEGRRAHRASGGQQRHRRGARHPIL